MNVNELMQKLVNYTQDSENLKDPIQAGNRPIFTEGLDEDMFRPLIDIDWTPDGFYLIGGERTSSIAMRVPPSREWYLQKINEMLAKVRLQLKADERLASTTSGRLTILKAPKQIAKEDVADVW